jgi:hypothetical protein
LFKEHAGVVAVDRADDAEHDYRQKQQNDSLHPALGRQRLDLALDAEALADDRGQLLEQLGQVASGLLLHQERQYENLDLKQAGAASQIA